MKYLHADTVIDGPKTGEASEEPTTDSRTVVRFTADAAASEATARAESFATKLHRAVSVKARAPAAASPAASAAPRTASSDHGMMPGFEPFPSSDFEPSVIERMPTPRPQPVAPAEMPAAGTRTRGHLLAMFSCRGGAGTTTLAVNAAAQLARAGKSVCVVDLDLQLGDVFVALDLDAKTSLAAIAREASTIDGAALKRRLAHHESGVFALSQASDLDDIDPQLVERIPALMATLTDHFDYVIVDGIRDLGDYALGVLDIADEIALVLTQDVPAVRRAARAINLFRRLGYGDNRIRIVLNRADGGEINEAAITRALSFPVAARIREDHKRVRQALNAGALVSKVAPRSKVVGDYATFAGMLRRSEPASEPSPPAKRSMFSFLRGKAK